MNHTVGLRQYGLLYFGRRGDMLRVDYHVLYVTSAANSNGEPSGALVYAGSDAHLKTATGAL